MLSQATAQRGLMCQTRDLLGTREGGSSHTHLSVENFIPAGENPGFKWLLSPLLLTKQRCVISACHWLPPRGFLTDELGAGDIRDPPVPSLTGRESSHPGTPGIAFTCSLSRASSCQGGAGGVLRELSPRPWSQNQRGSSSHGWGRHLSPENVTWALRMSPGSLHLRMAPVAFT